MKSLGAIAIMTLILVGAPALSEDGFQFKNGKCFGKFLTNRSLAALGISEKDLKIGVDCFQGNFDGSGNPEAAIVSFAKSAKGKALDAAEMIRWKITVVFMDATGEVLKVIPLKEKFFNLPALYSREKLLGTERENSSLNDDFGCSKENSVDGIMSTDNGDLSRLFLWDALRGDFIPHTCAGNH